MAKQSIASRSSQSWDGVADWYAGWSGPRGSIHHRKLAIPAVLQAVDGQAGERLLDLGCGPGALAEHASRLGLSYTGVDLSGKLISRARKHHAGAGRRFIVANVTDPALPARLGDTSFDAAVFMLSVQDINPLQPAIDNAAILLRPGGRLVMLMTHPCFRIPRQSGWGWDGGRQLQYRRIDTYLSPLNIPMQRHQSGQGTTRSYHRPLSHYVSALVSSGFLVDQLVEIPMLEALQPSQKLSRAERRAAQEIPLFLLLRAQKVN
ncbi:class I SAM-dependent methyltransferase [Saccharospirillum sp. HFRX-1]|uniref:class I SAM-dependent methyltransferase n=1 Tax=unclassified Saccharospirillum TaxID=2633430 RepID=UPI0037225369